MRYSSGYDISELLFFGIEMHNNEFGRNALLCSSLKHCLCRLHPAAMISSGSVGVRER